MIRAFILDRRCVRYASSNRWLQCRNNSTRGDTNPIHRVHRSVNRHHPSTRQHIHFRCLSSNPKPFYDFEEEDDSPDNFNKYDNYSQYGSSEGSLLDLLDQQDDQRSNPGQEDESLLGLLNIDEEKPLSSNAENERSLIDLLGNEDHLITSTNDRQRVLGDSTDSQANASLISLLGDDYSLEQTQENYDEAHLSSYLREHDTSKSKYDHLQRLQLQLEIESSEEATAKSLSVWESARERSDLSTIPVIRNELSSWYATLTAAIEQEQWMYLNGDNKSLTSDFLESNSDKEKNVEEDSTNGTYHGIRAKKSQARDRTVYGPLLCLLPPQKIAILLAHTALSSTVAEGDTGTKVVSLALKIADTLETEINVSRALRVRASREKAKLANPFEKSQSDNNDEQLSNINIPETEGNALKTSRVSADNADIDKWVYTATHLQRFLDEVSNIKSGSPEQKLLKNRGRVNPNLVRRKCQEILLAEGFFIQDNDDSTSARPLSMNDFADWDPVVKVKLGAALIQLLLDHTTYSKTRNPKTGSLEPAFMYSRKKLSQNANMRFQGIINLHPKLIHLAMKTKLAPDSVFLLTQNSRCQPMVIPPKDWTSFHDGGYEALKVDFMRTRQCKTQKDAIRSADLTKVFEGLNVLGRIPWRINKNVLEVALKCWEEGVVLGDIPAQTDHDVPPLPEKPEYFDLNSLEGEEKEAQIKALKAYKDALTKHFRFKQKNMDLHSLRCSAMLKLGQAEKFKDFEEVFFPYNVDFRGRAYPVPPHLSIVGSDLCRALLMFAHPKPLGPNGLYWLKVHLANLAGANKMSFDGRAQFADDNMENIRAAVNDPLGGNNWWMEFDDPFQGLATCHEIIAAIDSGDPPNYLCSLPVHMDGSCNGLQHYAALGRDKHGGKAVNLCIAEKPQDVYSGVMHEVIRRVAEDAQEQLSFDINKNDLSRSEKEKVKKLKSAQLVNGLIDRGVVKRTVMTSVYGVTYIGAKNQISEKIEEKLEERGVDIDEIEQEIHTACGYLASLTMEVMGQQFTGARETMNWLTQCARLISSHGQPVAFVSPIGVPVVQPYRQKRPVTVVTLLQRVVLTYDSDVLPLHRQRQVSAFPPNYVHSLDSSHMLLTAIEMQKRGLYFSAVHDSYWTHPCDIEEMNNVLRESFIELYDQPLLEDLKRRWEMRYPSITFPDLPPRGDLNLNDVRSAPYFFQ